MLDYKEKRFAWKRIRRINGEMIRIDVSHLVKEIHGVRILDDVNLTLEGGHIYGLRGKNGSGKTMFMRCLCGLIYPSSGNVSVNGQELGKIISFPESVGVLIENPAFLDCYTGFQNLKIIAMLRSRIDDADIRATLCEVGLDPDDKRKYRKYSLGMKQRLGIACAIMERPDIIILDEPINALDENGVELVRKLLVDLKQQGKLIIVACHDNEELESLADTIYSVKEGRITLEEE